MEKGKFQSVAPGEPLGRLANALAEMTPRLSREYGISKMDVCSAMCNAVGFILADAGKPGPGGKALPKENAFSRMDDLRKIMEAAYEIRSTEGGG